MNKMVKKISEAASKIGKPTLIKVGIGALLSAGIGAVIGVLCKDDEPAEATTVEMENAAEVVTDEPANGETAEE